MSARIRVLSREVANQIAAGEVIERPASVVKELLENALDAGCTHIRIDIGFGGLNHIIISDNGSGILKEDLPLAIAPHATSKLQLLDDLYSIHTMGFRGEALASIASISRLMITSKTTNASEGACLRCLGTEIEILPAAHHVGTTVEVHDLFYNAPVRKNFLKSASLEYLAIEGIVKRFAFSKPGIAIQLFHNHKLRLNLPAVHTNMTARLSKLFGQSFLDNAIYIDAQQEDLTLKGWVSVPHFARSQQDKQWMYINKRSVKDKLLMHAVKVAYEPLAHLGRHPLYLLYLELLSNEIDVNVHPTKHEVRFTKPREVHDFVHAAIARALNAPSEQAASRPLKQTQRAQQHAPSFLGLTTSLTDWVTLNDAYALLTFEDHQYVVDVIRLRRETIDWSTGTSRPLLVPLFTSILSARHQVLLESLGFVFKLHPDKIQVEAIPAAFPSLDLHYFFKHLPDLNAEKDELLALLFHAEGWNLHFITEEDKLTWLNHWQNLMQHHQGTAYAVRLDTEKCEALFHE